MFDGKPLYLQPPPTKLNVGPRKVGKHNLLVTSHQFCLFCNGLIPFNSYVRKRQKRKHLVNPIGWVIAYLMRALLSRIETIRQLHPKNQWIVKEKRERLMKWLGEFFLRGLFEHWMMCKCTTEDVHIRRLFMKEYAAQIKI